jgi:O-antigen/teichoic acid export membrane protein
MVGGLAMLMMGVILPVATVAARDDRPRLQYVLAHTTKLALLAGGLLGLTLAVAARPIVVLLGGEPFAPAATVLRLQAPVVLTIFLVYTWTTFLIADGRRRDLVRCMLIGTLTLVVSGIALVARFGAEGGALAALVADVVLATVSWAAARRVGDGRVGIERAYLVRYGAALAAAAGTALAVAAVAPAAAAAAVAAAIFTGLAFALRLVPSELTALLPRR